MRRFEVGQRVRVNCPLSLHHGKVTTVTSGLMWMKVRVLDEREWLHVYRVDIKPAKFTTRAVVFEPHELIPIDDPPELGSWSDLADIWQPRRERA